jgi:hypothetical protein
MEDEQVTDLYIHIIEDAIPTGLLDTRTGTRNATQLTKRTGSRLPSLSQCPSNTTWPAPSALFETYAQKTAGQTPTRQNIHQLGAGDEPGTHDQCVVSFCARPTAQ